LRESQADPLQHGKWLQALWVYYLLNDDHARARDAIENALQLLIDARAEPGVVLDITADLSYSLILLGEVAKAKEYLRRAIVLAGTQGDREVLADLYYGIGDAYRKTGERMVSRRYFEAALEIDRSSSDQSKAVVSQLKLGSLARDAGNYDEAIQRHERALKQFRSSRDYRELVTEIELARDHAARGSYERAARYANDALEDLRALPEQRIDASLLLLSIANDRRERGARTPEEEAQAARLMRSVEALLGGSSARQKSSFARPTQQLHFFEQAIRHYALLDDLDRVQAHGAAAIRLARRVARDLSATNDDSLAWLTQAQPVLNAYVKALYEIDRSQVFSLLEAYYGQRVDSGSLRHAGVIGRAFEAQAVERFDLYREAEAALVDAAANVERLRGAGDARMAQARLDLQSKLRTRDFARDSYLAIYTAPATSELPEELDAVASRALPALPAGDLLIRYFVQETVSFGAALAADGGIEYFDLPRRSEIQKLARNVAASLNMPGAAPAKREALAALAVLLPPALLLRYPDAKRLVIVADDAVQQMPFSAIDLSQPSQPYLPLVRRFETVRTRSASRYYANDVRLDANPAAATAADIVVFADPIVGSASASNLQLRTSSRWADGLFRLPNSRLEAESIAKAFSTRNVQSHIGAAATNDVLLSPAVRSAKVVHIATHGYFNAATPDLVGLATSPTSSSAAARSGFLGLTELFTEPFSSRLVVVSGCETMRGMDYSGWGVRSLADGFLAQGAGSVVGALWSIPDAATARLMDGFYRSLAGNGGNSSAALREAQREMARSGPLSDPYFWAALVLESSNRSMDQRAL
jgi:CHAT domain-containing protein